MISLTKIEPPILFPRPAVLTDGEDLMPGMSRRWDQPDPKINPRYWAKFYLEGLSPVSYTHLTLPTIYSV